MMDIILSTQIRVNLFLSKSNAKTTEIMFREYETYTPSISV